MLILFSSLFSSLLSPSPLPRLLFLFFLPPSPHGEGRGGRAWRAGGPRPTGGGRPTAPFWVGQVSGIIRVFL